MSAPQVPSHAGLVTALLLAVAVSGCGSSGTSSAQTSRSTGAASPSPAARSAGASGALSADARSAGTGDIPDNQVFLTFTDPTSGWSMRYPEGWTQQGSGASVTFSDKNNLVHVAVRDAAAPSAASVGAALQALQATNPSLRFTSPAGYPLPADPSAIKATYTTRSAPNPVTGKQVVLMVDRYVLHRGSRVATVDLGTPRGVDNVDAYRMMIRSFRWR